MSEVSEAPLAPSLEPSSESSAEVLEGAPEAADLGSGSGAPPEAAGEVDPLQEIRAGLGLPERSGGTPIHSNLDVTLRRLGWGMLALGTAFLVLWRVLSWVNA